MILWILQIFFLQTFYQQMKIQELYNAADAIEKSYGTDDYEDTILSLTSKSDMYIQIDRGGASISIDSWNNMPSFLGNRMGEWSPGSGRRIERSYRFQPVFDEDE